MQPPAPEARRPPDIQAGRIIAGKFRLTRQLGQGGMGSVWAAVHETLGREVAVKFLQPQRGQSPSLTDRFVSEAHMVASIKHRFVVDVFDYGVTDDGIYYMVLELLHGRSLADRMDHGPPMNVRQAVQLMADCLRGLHVVHEAGIIHRDLKPDNIFVVDDVDGLYPKLIDFGISRRTHPANLKLDAPGTVGARRSRLTQPGTVLGTPYYMSPEQLRGRSNIDRRSDVYAVGVILFELLAGRLPFDQDNVGDLMVAITVSGPPSLTAIRPELGGALALVIRRALSANPDDRYASALELREALVGLAQSLPPGAQCAVQTEIADMEAAEKGTSLQLTAVKPFAPAPQPAAAPAPADETGGGGFGLWFGLVFLVAFAFWLWSSSTWLRPTISVPLHATGEPPRAPEPASVSGASPEAAPVPVDDLPPPSAAQEPSAADPQRAAAAEPAPPVVAEEHTPPLTAAGEPAAQRDDAPRVTPVLTHASPEAGVPDASKAQSPQPGAASRANPPSRPAKAARWRSRTRATGLEPPQKLYRKLDF